MPKSQISAGRQILVNFGNRYVVFGPPSGMPADLAFGPADLEVLPRVASEEDVAESRIIQTIRVTGLTRVEDTASELDSDIEFRDEQGFALFVDVRTRDGPIRQSDFVGGYDRARQAQAEGRTLETWFFNIDRLSLTIVGTPDPGRESRWEVLEVWEKTKDTLFGRSDVLDSVRDWELAIEGLYGFAKEALGADTSLEFDTSRTYTMSEELMHKFAVADRELPILDVVREGEVLASFIPRALWVIGSYGRIDVVTRAGTSLLVRNTKGDQLDWQFVNYVDRRRTERLDAQSLRAIVG